MGAQRLYLLLSTSPSTTLAGVADWRPKRMLALSDNTTEDDLVSAMEELVESSLVSVDEVTEEAWLKPMIVDDGLLRGAKTTAGVIAAWAMVGSTQLRVEIADHIRELAETGLLPGVQAMLAPILSYGLPEPVKPKTVPIPPERPKVPKATRFDEFWNAYPKERHQGKAGAMRKYEAAVNRGVSEQEIIDGAIRYAVARFEQDHKYTKMPETWLNKGCWADEMEETSNGGDLYNPENGWA